MKKVTKEITEGNFYWAELKIVSDSKIQKMKGLFVWFRGSEAFTIKILSKISSLIFVHITLENFQVPWPSSS